MAHNIEFNEQFNRYSFVECTNSGKDRAWHNLGQVYDTPLSITEALEGCNANFNVTKQPLIALPQELVDAMNNGKFINASVLKDLVIDTHVATMRDDNNSALGVVSPSYGVVQNTEAFQFIDDLCTGGEGKPCIECAGLLGNGERIFVTAKFPEPIKLAHKDNDLVEMYIVFTTSHNGKGAVSALVTPTRVVCNNTLNLAFHNNKGRWNVRHTSNVNNRLGNIAEASRALNLYDVYKAEFEERMEQLSKIHLTDKDVDMFAAKALMTEDVWKVYVNNNYQLTDDISTKAKNQIDALKNTIYGGVGQSLLETNTGLHIYNGLTCYLANTAPNKNEERQFTSLIEGSAYEKQQKGYDFILSKVA